MYWGLESSSEPGAAVGFGAYSRAFCTIRFIQVLHPEEGCLSQPPRRTARSPRAHMSPLVAVLGLHVGCPSHCTVCLEVTEPTLHGLWHWLCSRTWKPPLLGQTVQYSSRHQSSKSDIPHLLPNLACPGHFSPSIPWRATLTLIWEKSHPYWNLEPTGNKYTVYLGGHTETPRHGHVGGTLQEISKKGLLSHTSWRFF